MFDEMQFARRGLPAGADVRVRGGAAEREDAFGHVRVGAFLRRRHDVPGVRGRLQGELDLLEVGALRGRRTLRRDGEVAESGAAQDFCLGTAYMGRRDKAILTEPQEEGGASHEEAVSRNEGETIRMIFGRARSGVPIVFSLRRSSGAPGAACPKCAPSNPFSAGAENRRRTASGNATQKQQERWIRKAFFDSTYSYVPRCGSSAKPLARGGTGPAFSRGSVRDWRAGRNPAALLTGPNQTAYASGASPLPILKNGTKVRAAATPTHPAALARSSSTPVICAGRGAPFSPRVPEAVGAILRRPLAGNGRSRSGIRRPH